MQNIKDKSIIIAIPNHFQLPERFKENLEFIGFKVFLIPIIGKVKIGLINTIIHVYKKTIKGIRTFKSEKKAELRAKKQLELIKNENNQYDYALLIRPDLFSTELIEEVKSRSHKISAYQWDGLDRFPLVYQRINLFDRFFVFDENDLKKDKKLLFITNFYFDDIPKNENKLDVYFVGTYMKNRINILLKLARKLKLLGLNTSINVHLSCSSKRKELKKEPINMIAKPMSFKENNINVSQARIILDFANDIHYGISMRTFEAIGHKKKLITNNPLVKKYDFYHPNNIYVIENDNFDDLEEFISIPYQNLPEDINVKYSFSNWIKYVLNINPHIPILTQK